eukprot:1161882-Pelagomonas_calceolata.AAC.2
MALGIAQQNQSAKLPMLQLYFNPEIPGHNQGIFRAWECSWCYTEELSFGATVYKTSSFL